MTNRSFGLASLFLAALVAFSPAAFADQRDPPRPVAPPAPTRDATPNPAAGTGVIRGVVLSDEASPRPVRRAAVTLSASATFGGRMALTDDSGRFEITGVPAGRFSMLVSKPGWVANYYGGLKPGRGFGSAIVVSDGKTVNIEMRLLRGSVISGRVGDQNGSPLAGLRLAVSEFRTLGTERVLSSISLPSLATLPATDDRGEFRIFGLSPGSYVVSATPLGSASATTGSARLTTADEVRWAMNPLAGAQIPAEGRMAGYAPVYYPGTADLASAVEVTVGPGEERTGIDFVLPLVPIARIAGTVIRADGLPAQGAQVNLRAAGMSSLSAALDTIQLRAVADASGRFVLSSVKPGQYTVIALAASRPTAAPAPPAAGGGGIAPGRLAVQAGSMDLYARSELVVTGQDVEDLNITLQPGATLSGRVVYEATTLASSAEPLRASIQLMPPTLAAILRMSGADTYSAVVNADASFSLSVAPGTWALNATPITTPADAWFLKSIQLRGQDVTDTPLDVRGGSDISGIVVTLSDRSAEISGSFVDATGKPAPGYFVAVFPVDRPNWGALVRRFRPPSLPSTDGKFRITGLPPGDYYVVALTDIDPIDMLDESFVQTLIPAAFRITLREGEKKVQDFRIK